MSSTPSDLHRPALRALASALALVACSTAGAADVVVRVGGLTEPLGQVGCSLFAGPDGFPMDTAPARVAWLPASAKDVTCRFAAVPEGRYAVSVGHDLNGNRRVDTNLVGMPTEQWGVSGNVRPTLRAPRFDEAVFRVAAGAGDVVIDITVAK
ncbi:MAG: DUF2141 domain-containing protein [Burkholderiales bacterium]|nr:MAG: DUF2141 domain-containing protein [Burkholderiales bacterium]